MRNWQQRGPRHYILVDGQPVATDLYTWARRFEDSMRTIALSWVDMQGKEVEPDAPGAIARISTVFLGIDHGWNGGPPVLWETMVFVREPHVVDFRDVGGKRHVMEETSIDESQRRYTSREEALAGHAETLALLARTLQAQKPLITSRGTHWYDGEEDDSSHD